MKKAFLYEIACIILWLGEAPYIWSLVPDRWYDWAIEEWCRQEIGRNDSLDY